MSSQAYVGATKRTFAQAFIHELETNYGFLNSKRVLSLLAEDVQRLVDQFYPRTEHVHPGWMIFTGTKADGAKAYPGQSASDLKTVTLAWPVLTEEDVTWMATHADTVANRQTLLQRRLVRVIEHGWQYSQGPVVLTLADLSLMFSLNTVEVSHRLTEARLETGKPLLTKGYFFDQGMRPTHKAEIVTLYEQGMDEADIARQTTHSPTSVGHYLRDYERVKEMVKHHIEAPRICRLLGMQPSVVDAYPALVQQFHPEFFPEDDSAHIGT
jgi:hypothetical protein